ncbi:MAG TPA: hypothetical protein VGW57_15560 [Chthoniobacterales bacterium]|nr:hypothetical protein [Chthoniobacterales bacterium]
MTRPLGILLLCLAAGLVTLKAQTTSTTTDPNPTGDTGALKSQIQTGGSYDAHSGNATRIVNDLKVPGALGVYGLDFTRYWNSLDFNWDNPSAGTPDGFGWSGWFHSWAWTAVYEEVPPTPVRGTDQEGNQYVTAINITFPDGHTTRFKIVRLSHSEWLVEGSENVWGPPYTAGELLEFTKGGEGVHDHICNMDPNTGADFYLCLADGGSVHFVNFVATEVFDPHGLRTGLYYKADGNLEYIEQDGGRFIKLTWDYFSGGGSVITKVEGGTGPNRTGINQTVTYQYAHSDGSPQNSGSTSALVLQNVFYENELDPTPGAPPGQKVNAFYSYGSCWDHVDQYPGECVYPNGAPQPVLQRADDPHFAGPMAIIRYSYRGEACPTLYQPPEYHPNYIHAQPYAIAAEKSDNGVTVSSFSIGCDDGLRTEYDGLGNSRTFYFGTSAQTADPPLVCRGFQLGKLTDFWRMGEAAAPFEKQNFSFGHPRHIWDGRNIMTEATYGQDDSGQPEYINRVDGAVDHYDRVNPGASEAIDPARGMHNPYNHWVFSETHQVNAATSHTTTYTRDSRRRVTRIDYPDGSSETFQYDNGLANGFNQVTNHHLPSGAVISMTYDSRGLLLQESNSVDQAISAQDYTSYTYYGGGNHPEWADLVETSTNGRTRAAGTFATRMSYNGRHQITKVEYPDAPQTACAPPPSPTPSPTPTATATATATATPTATPTPEPPSDPCYPVAYPGCDGGGPN